MSVVRFFFDDIGFMWREGYFCMQFVSNGLILNKMVTGDIGK